MPVADARVRIAAPLDRVFAVMIDFASYPRWNPFVIRVDGEARVGAPLALTVRWKGGGLARSPERVIALEPPARGRARLAYRYEGLPSRFGAVRGDREQTLLALGPDATEYRTREEFHGFLRAFVPLAAVQDGFERHAQALCQEVERQCACEP